MAHARVCICICGRVCMYTYVRLCLCLFLCVCACVCVHVCAPACMLCECLFVGCKCDMSTGACSRTPGSGMAAVSCVCAQPLAGKCWGRGGSGFLVGAGVAPLLKVCSQCAHSGALLADSQPLSGRGPDGAAPSRSLQCGTLSQSAMPHAALPAQRHMPASAPGRQEAAPRTSRLMRHSSLTARRRCITWVEEVRRGESGREVGLTAPAAVRPSWLPTTPSASPSLPPHPVAPGPPLSPAGSVPAAAILTLFRSWWVDSSCASGLSAPPGSPPPSGPPRTCRPPRHGARSSLSAAASSPGGAAAPACRPGVEEPLSGDCVHSVRAGPAVPARGCTLGACPA